VKKRQKGALDFSRRQLLTLMGGCSTGLLLRTPMQTLIDGLVDGIIHKAHAGANPSAVQSRNYVLVCLSGAPARWYFDLPLEPYAPRTAIPNPMVATRFAASSGTNAGMPVYASVPVSHGGQTVHLPYLWSCSIPTPGGGRVPMSELAKNMLIIRGVDMLADGHPNNREKVLRPDKGSPSMNGLVADGSSAVIPSVTLGGAPSDIFRSSKARGNVTLGALDSITDPLSSILSPFNRNADTLPPNYLSRRQAMETAIQRGLTSLKKYSESASPGAGDVFDARHRAEEMLRNGIGDASASYTTLKAKYADLIRRCAEYATNPIAGITDKRVDRASYSSLGGHEIFRVDDGITALNPDMRTLLLSETTIPHLAGGFAIAEYLIANGLGASVVLGVNLLSMVRWENPLRYLTTNIPTATVNAGLTFDEHFRGLIVSLITDSFLFQALGACLYELTQVLRQKQLYDETVISVGAEFSRVPRNDRTGSDHGWMGNTFSIFSGAVKAPMVVGNILSNATLNAPVYSTASTWGHASPVQVDGATRSLSISHVCATVAELLRVKKPVAGSSTLVREGSSGISNTISLAANVVKP